MSGATGFIPAVPASETRRYLKSLVGGYHKPPTKRGGKPGLHAVSQGVLNGGRKSVCGLIGRFMPVDDWEPYPNTMDGCCEDCIKQLTNHEMVKAASGWGRG